MKNKRRLIVLLLTLAMVMSQMSLVAFADNEPAGESDQTVTEQAAVETAFDQTVTENGVDITVKAAEGVFPAGAKLSAKKVDVPDAIDAENALAFDIKILADGEEVQPKDNAKVEVSFKAAEVKKDKTEVYHMDGSKADKLDVETKGTTATVETTGFSTYVLVFTSEAGAGGSKINYSMGDNQEVALETIVGTFRPTLPTYGYVAFEKYNYDAATVDLDSKIQLFNNGANKKAIRVKSEATFDDGEEATLTIPYTYTYKESSGGETKTGNGTITITITVTDTSAPGSIVAPTAKEGLIYSGSAQQIITAGKTSVGTMQYQVGSGNWVEAVSDITGTNAGDYKVYWRVVLKNGTKTSTVDSGEISATINKKAATLTIQGGTSTYTGTAVDIATAANVAFSGLVNSEKLTKDTDYRLTADPATIKEVGEYYIDAETIDTSATLKNYDLAIVSGTYTITEKSASTITADVKTNKAGSEPTSYMSGFEWVYDGEKHGIVVTPKAGETTIKDATVYYGTTVLNSGNFSTYGDTNPENVYPTNAGTYPIYYYIVADGYQPLAGSQTVKIDQAYLRVAVAPAEKTVTYGDHVNYQNQSWTAALNAGNVTFKAFKDEAETESTTLPVVTASIGNLDKLAFDMGTYSGDMSDVGNYNIDLQNNLTSPNYVIRTTGGTLKVTPKPVDFYWLSEPDGKTEDFTWSYDGQEHGLRAYITDGQLVGTDAGEGQVEIIYETRKPNEYTNAATNVKRNESTWAVEDYTAKVWKLGGERGHNYTFYKTGDTLPEGKTVTSEQTFRITPVELTLTPDPLEITYGDSPSDKQYSQTFTPSGLVNEEKIEDVLKGTPTYWYGKNYGEDAQEAYVAGDSDVDKYDIHITNIEDTPDAPIHNQKTGLHAQNYQVKAAVATDKLDVVQREVTIIWKDPENLEYDGGYKEVVVERADNDCTAGSTATKKTENSVLYGAKIVESKETTPLKIERVNADEYNETVELAERAAKNFKVLDNSDKHAWTITQRPATIYVNNNTITYGQAPADKGYYVANKTLVTNVETGKDSIAEKVELVPNYSKNGKPGSYAITAKLTKPNKNYRIVAIKQGTLTVVDRVGTLMAKGTKSGKKGILVSWNSVSGAASYDVYMSLCNTKKKVRTPVYVGSTYGNSLKVTKIGKKKLKAKKTYKYYVVAKNASGAVIAQSQLGHFITNNVKGKKVNAKSMAVNTHVVSIGKGGTAGLSASYTKAKKGKKYKLLDAWHSPLTRYATENPAVATVDANGTVYGVGKGWTRVYVIGVSGMWETVEVYVN